jgi:TonB family protein
MNDRSHDENPALPPDMAELDAELSSIRYEERPSFGPELEAELAREWLDVRARPPLSVHALVAAALAGLLLVSVAVPQARASLVRFVTRLQSDHEQTVKLSPPPATRPSQRSAATPGPRSGSFVLPPVGDREDSLPVSGPVGVFAGAAVTFPKLLDRPGAEALIRRHYPVALQRAHVGGTVRLRLWVDSTGSVDFVALGSSSGVPDLDRAALQVAPSFRFRPARRFGAGVGTWVEFNVEFKPGPTESDSTSLPKAALPPAPQAPDTDRPDLTPQWQRRMVLSAPGRRGAEDLLRSAIGDDRRADQLGPIGGILDGDPPAGVGPTQWRAEVGRAMERAMVRDPDNPAPFLALGRLRRKQGLRSEADALFRRGLERAEREGRTTSPELLAALEYERGKLLEESWLGSRNLGTVPLGALSAAACRQAGDPSAGSDTAYATADQLITWSYMCPRALEEVWRKGFQPDASGTAARDLDSMMASFEAAVSAQPDHDGANVGLLLGLADEGRWSEVLTGARRFAEVSNGAPDALLLSGLALERLSRPEEAEVQFHLALEDLPAASVAELEDVRSVATPAQLARYAGLRAEDRQGWLDAFWAPLDPILSTAVNERRVEHLARAAYAYLRFGSTTSQPGQVWMRYGRPDRIRVIASGSDVRTEFWDYGIGPDITFRRMGLSTGLTLTSEGRSYLTDLEQVYPVRYGSSGRMVTPLGAQVTRFRGTKPATTDVEIDAEVPDALVAGGADSLDLSIFQLGADGKEVWSVKQRVPAKRVSISFHSVGSSEVRRLAVELMDRTSGRVAVLRAPARLEDHGAGNPSASDLLLTSPDIPQKWESTPDRDWLHAQTLAGPVTGDELGAYFEIYDLPASLPWYRLRAELEDRGTGEVRSVPIEPAGKTGFRPTWDFRPTPGKAAQDFVIVSLARVPAGSYTLRLVADLPGAGSPVTASRDFDLHR